MNDMELLELAAKAAGMVYLSNGQTYAHLVGNFNWNPLTDDGDALRLAVKIFEANEIYELWCKVGALRAGTEADFDPYAATRRAIVRAAADIGKGMP